MLFIKLTFERLGLERTDILYVYDLCFLLKVLNGSLIIEFHDFLVRKVRKRCYLLVIRASFWLSVLRSMSGKFVKN